MKKHQISKKTGMALAIAAAGLVHSGALLADGPAASDKADLVHCYGVNICGGHNDCKTAENDCAGKATCKGTGFVAMPSKSCTDVGGETRDEWVGEVSSADLTHCYGVNVCGGHNDCKTADNSCAGQATCKGTGFVAAPAKSCADIGGKEGA
jgi:uncharacterized membrane protein